MLCELAAEEAARPPPIPAVARPTGLKSARADIRGTGVCALPAVENTTSVRRAGHHPVGARWGERRRLGRVLMRMYIRWAEARHQIPVEVFDTSYAEKAGIQKPRSPHRSPPARCRSNRAPTPAGADQPFDNQSPATKRRSPKSKCCRWRYRPHCPEACRVDVYRQQARRAISERQTQRCGSPTFPKRIVVTTPRTKSQLQEQRSLTMRVKQKLLEPARRRTRRSSTR